MKKTLLALFAAILTFGLYSCDKENMGGVDLGDFDVPAEYFVQLDEANTIPDLYEATMTTDMQMIPAQYEGTMMMKGDKGNKGGKNDKMPPKGKRFFRFGEIFAQMELNEEQLALVPDILKAHYACIFEAKMTLRLALEDIFAQAREERLAIITAYKNGEITREEVRAQLDALNTTMRETIQNSEAHAAFELAMCECFNEMISSIEAILDDTQLEMWKAWLETIEHPCLVD